MADDAGTQTSFLSLINSGLQFATPFAQRLLGTTSTPQQLTNERLNIAALNGSGPLDANSSRQSPQGLLDFITGRTNTQNSSENGRSNFFNQSNLTFIGIALVAVVALIVILKK